MKIGSVLLLAMLGLGCGGYGSSPNMTTPQPGVVPTIKSLTPSSMNSGGLAFTLTVNGTGFARNAVVKWNGTQRTTSYVNGSRVMANIQGGDIAHPGTMPVTVTNPGTPASTYGGAGTSDETSNTVNFTIN